ncbi:MAG: RHS repeat protein, partial [Treponema sp.]|nr:RHS repeat protein [Treponema sp.]
MKLWLAIQSRIKSGWQAFFVPESLFPQIVIQIDGLGRAVRTAKTGCVNGEAGWNASGAVEYDCKGRTVKEGMTEFIGGTITELLQSSPKMTELFTSYEYDEKDRPVTSILPDNSVQKNAYYMAEDRLVSESTDPLGNVSVQEADGRGNIVRVARKDNAGRKLTEVTYEYNEMGEMLKAFDAKGHPISVEYDLLGRRTALESLDSGRQDFFYDE